MDFDYSMGKWSENLKELFLAEKLFKRLPLVLMNLKDNFQNC
jgi:hypothetical protein